MSVPGPVSMSCDLSMCRCPVPAAKFKSVPVASETINEGIVDNSIVTIFPAFELSISLASRIYREILEIDKKFVNKTLPADWKQTFWMVFRV